MKPKFISELDFIITNPKKSEVIAFCERRGYCLVQDPNNAFIFNYEHGTEVLEELQKNKGDTTIFNLVPLKDFYTCTP